MDLLKMTPDVKSRNAAKKNGQKTTDRVAVTGASGNSERSQATEALNNSGLLEEEDFFDFISRFQSKRMDDQRCSLAMPTATARSAAPPAGPAGRTSSVPSGASGAPKDNLMEMIVGAQGYRMNEQRATLSFLPGLNRSKQPEILQRLSVAANNDQNFPDDSFFEMLMKCQGSRYEEQRSSLPHDGVMSAAGEDGGALPHAPTVPDEDFFSLIQRLQGGRLEDQRAHLPKGKDATQL
jgi:G-protein signaling modulator 2